jgi:hypothetical protein
MATDMDIDMDLDLTFEPEFGINEYTSTTAVSANHATDLKRTQLWKC